MKRILSVILSVSLIVSLFACNTFSAFAADQEVQATETTETVVVNHYTDATTKGTAAGIQSLKDDGDITTGSVLLNGDLANHKYKLISYYVGSTPTETNPHIQLKGLANNPYGSNDLNANSLKRQTGTKTAKGTDCYAFTEGRDSKGYYQIYSYGDSSANNGYGDQFGIEYLDIENTDANARAKAVVQYDLGDGWNVSDLVLGWGDTQYRAGYYVVLTSANGKDYIEQYRYTSDKIGDSTVTNSNVQHIKLKTPVYAKYVQIHFYAAVNSVASAKFKEMIVNNSVIRVKTIQIFGVPEFEFDDHGTYSNSTDANYVIPAATEDTYKNEVLDNRTSLVAGLTPVSANYFVSSESAVGTSFDNGDGTLKDAYTYDAKTAFTVDPKYSKRFTDGALFNADLTLTDDAVLRRMFINLNMATDDSKQVFKTHFIDDESKQWIQLDYDLGATTKVSQFALVGKTKPRYNASHYKYYVSDTVDGLYKEENCVAEIGTAAAIGSVKLLTPKEGRYVGIRFICIHNTELSTNLSLSALYSRASEFAVFGSYKNVADTNVNVTIATEEGVPSTLIQKSEPTYIGNPDSDGNYAAAAITATATEYYEDTDAKKVYTFAGWYKGEELVSANAEYVYNLANGAATLTAKYTVEKICAKKGHSGGTATCVSQAICDVCEEPYGELNPNGHKYTTYVYNNDATCLKDGTKTAICDYGCGKGTHTVTATGTKKTHSYTRTYVASKATLSADGIIRKACACGAYINSGKISKIKTVKLSYTSKSYTGKSLKPTVTVKDAAGKTLKEKTDYTVTYSKNKSVGKATAKVVFINNYSGTKTLTFKIVPKKTSISSLKAGKKSLTVKFKKQTSGSGYEIQYSTSKSFKGAKTVKISKNKTVSKTIKKLKSKKTYYVRVRVVKGSYKSSWSSDKKVKVK